MKNVFFLFIIISTVCKGQDVTLNVEKSKVDFCLGSKAEIITTQSKAYANYLLNNKIKLLFEDQVINYEVEKIFDTLLIW